MFPRNHAVLYIARVLLFVDEQRGAFVRCRVGVMLVYVIRGTTIIEEREGKCPRGDNPRDS